jgi:hypothetical protein
MVFWMAILFGGLFAWLAVRLGFYETWILLFNILISVYLGIFLASRVSALAPGTQETAAYGIGLSMIVIAGGCFAILQGLSYVFLTGQFKIPFPQVFDIVGAGALGFLAGFVLLSFLALVITTTPLAEREAIRFVGFNREAQKGTITCLAGCCDLIHSMASSSPPENATQAVVDHLLREDRPPTDSNDPPQTAAEPNDPRPPMAPPSDSGPEGLAGTDGPSASAAHPLNGLPLRPTLSGNWTCESGEGTTGEGDAT